MNIMNLIAILFYATKTINLIIDLICHVGIELQKQPDVFKSALSSVLIGLITGLISSLVITHYYRTKDNFRDAKIFQRHLLTSIGDLAYQLTALHLASEHVQDMAIDFDLYYENIRSVYKSRPLFESRYNVLKANRKYYSKYEVICRKLIKQLNEYYRCMTVLSVYNREHLNMTHQEQESRIQLEQNKRHNTVMNLGVLGVDFLMLKKDIEEAIDS